MNNFFNRMCTVATVRPVRTAVIAVLFALAVAILPPRLYAKEAIAKPTVVLVHGAFADSSSWNGVTMQLLALGYPVVAVANPLRSVKGDANYAAGVVDAIKGPVVLVGHSYGGFVITNVRNEKRNIRALVYVAGFAPDRDETAAGLLARFPGGTLGPALAPPVDLATGGKDLYIQQGRFRSQFAADVPIRTAKLMAVSQRPIADTTLNEPSGAPAWKLIPSFFIYGNLDKNIPTSAQAFMAQRAMSRKTVEVKGASHVVMTSHPDEVARLIAEAATAQ